MHAAPELDTAIFREAIEALNAADLCFVIGGAFAVYRYTGVWRNTHDLDIYLERKYVPAAIESLTQHGFRDLGEMAAGDREWIYHASKDKVLVDLIWQSPHGLSVVDESFYTRSREGTFVEMQTRFMPPDELILAKIYTMNQRRCDWPDVLRIARACPDDLDWDLILTRMRENWPVLLSFIILFDWCYPGDACCVPVSLREELLRRKLESPSENPGPNRESILDPWIYTRPISP